MRVANQIFWWWLRKRRASGRAWREGRRGRGKEKTTTRSTRYSSRHACVRDVKQTRGEDQQQTNKSTKREENRSATGEASRPSRACAKWTS